jgi:hypothetical protein
VASGLPDGVADGLMCVDAVQFADPPLTELAELAEFGRVLVPGTRVALTCREAVEPPDGRVPAGIRAVNLDRDLHTAGFVGVQVRGKPDCGMPSGGSGRRRSRHQPALMRRSGPCKTKAAGRWKCSNRYAVSS